MSDTIITIIAIFIAAILMFIFPVVNIALEHDKTVQASVEAIVSDYANVISQKGRVTLDDYEAFINKLYSTGNTYNVKLEAKILDKNNTKLVISDNKNTAKYYSVYTNTIIEKIKIKDYYLKQGDLIIVTVENSNTTIGAQIKNFLYNLRGKKQNDIWANCTIQINQSGINSFNISGKLANRVYLVNMRGRLSEDAEGYIPYDFIICLDVSASMGTGTNLENTSLEKAKQATNAIINSATDLGKNSIKVISFYKDEATIVADSSKLR